MATQSNGFTPAIDRAKTAISRNDFSTPVRALLQSGLLNKKRSFFDYGCGRGDDVAGLAHLGYDVAGWDPEYLPAAPREPADIVNLGFVLNVIEDPGERKETLKGAWELAKQALLVTVISTWERPRDGLAAFSDGAVTQRGTFQKYYEPGELKGYVDDCLKLDSLPVSPVSVLCFRDPELEQEYLANSGTGASKYLPTPTHPLRKTRLSQCLGKFQTEDVESWAALVDWTRWHAIAPSESLVRQYKSLAACGLHASDVFSAITESYGEQEWARVVDMTRHRYVSQMALGFFRGKPKPRHFTMDDRKSIKLHFGSFDVALDLGRETLFDIGDASKIETACSETDFGLEDEQALYVHRSGVPYLPALLQTYIGAGRLFYGNIDDVDLFKIHKASGKLTLLLYDDFEASAEPMLQTRIKINFRARRIDYYDHRADQQRLLNKSAYLPSSASVD